MIVIILHQHILYRITLNLYIDLNKTFLQNLLIPHFWISNPINFNKIFRDVIIIKNCWVTSFVRSCSCICLKSWYQIFRTINMLSTTDVNLKFPTIVWNFTFGLPWNKSDCITIHNRFIKHNLSGSWWN